MFIDSREGGQWSVPRRCVTAFRGIKSRQRNVYEHREKRVFRTRYRDIFLYCDVTPCFRKGEKRDISDVSAKAIRERFYSLIRDSRKMRDPLDVEKYSFFYARHIFPAASKRDSLPRVKSSCQRIRWRVIEKLRARPHRGKYIRYAIP